MGQSITSLLKKAEGDLYTADDLYNTRRDMYGAGVETFMNAAGNELLAGGKTLQKTTDYSRAIFNEYFDHLKKAKHNVSFLETSFTSNKTDQEISEKGDKLDKGTSMCDGIEDMC